MPVGFYVDMTKCVGCRACQVVCKDKNRLDVGMIFRHANTYSVGQFPSVTGYSYSFTCNHCATPACLAACPVSAIYRADDGTVIIDQDICVGNQQCVSACPYSVPQYDAKANKSNKCDACYAIRQAGGIPACVASCPNRALDFGEYSDLQAKYGSGLVADIAVLPTSATTTPSLLIKAKDNATQTGFVEVAW